MKKLLNISVIAALAILPMAANATDYSVTDPTAADPATAASTGPGWALAQTAATDNTNLATAGYVKGAYNQAMKAINKVAATADTAVQSVTTGDSTSGNGTIKVDGQAVSVYGLGSAAFVNTGDLADTAGTYDNQTSGLTATTIQDAIDEVAGTAGTALQAADITSGTGNGTIAVDGTDVSVTGLGSAAFVNTGDLADTAGTYDNQTSGLTATTIQDAIDEVAGTAGTAVQSVTEGSTNGTIKVDGTDVDVHGLGSAAFVDTDDIAGTAGTYDDTNSSLGATTIQGAIEALDTAVDSMNTASANYAKKIGVTNTISASTISGTVPTVTAWGADTPGTAVVTASITGAAYTETAPSSGE